MAHDDAENILIQGLNENMCSDQVAISVDVK